MGVEAPVRVSEISAHLIGPTPTNLPLSSTEGSSVAVAKFDEVVGYTSGVLLGENSIANRFFDCGRCGNVLRQLPP
ncbi:MAG TPA: hypothetical protein DDW52_13500 [Planctomycetaceae bacterium]|nr:hypothetical protein [Planctomycetaceae bacterium]